MVSNNNNIRGTAVCSATPTPVDGAGRTTAVMYSNASPPRSRHRRPAGVQLTCAEPD
jgi:hypothetical protein